MIISLNSSNARHIAHHLRWTWAREVSACLANGGTPDELDGWADRMAGLPGERICVATADGIPAVMGGIVPQGHMGITWLAGTDRVSEVAVEFMRHVLRIHRSMESRGVRRFHAYCLEGPDDIFAWLDKLGYRREGRHPGMGVHGETYISFGKLTYKETP